MVTQVPGPKVTELMAESAKYESFTRGGGGFPVILEHGRGATVRDADGNLYIDMAAGVAVNAVGRGHPKVLGWRLLRRLSAIPVNVLTNTTQRA